MVWSSITTAAAGHISARGGSAGGDGGFIEVSGQRDLAVTAALAVDAPAGRAGRLRLDPQHLTLANSALFPQFDLLNPTPNFGDDFGKVVLPLSSGTVVVCDPSDDAVAGDAGAVYLFDGLTGALISTLTGSAIGDSVGSDVVALNDGNFVVRSPGWNNSSIVAAGAVTWGDGTTGISGTVSVANSLVGSSANDAVGSGVAVALDNGRYVVSSPSWSNGSALDVGAATWVSGASTTTGTVSAENSLIGSTAGDSISSSGITALTNGNYVVHSPAWDNGGIVNAGASTWGNGATGTVGTVSIAQLAGRHERWR